MLSFILAALFVVAALTAALSLVDSAIRLRHGWMAARRQVRSASQAPVRCSNPAVVLLDSGWQRPVARPARPLAAAA